MALVLASQPVPSRPGEIRACMVVRNEILRLQATLDHHRRLGVDRFLVVDNGSDDGSFELLLQAPDVHVFRTSDGFGESGYGLRWINTLLGAYCQDHWVLTIDADEFFIFPGSEYLGLRDFAAFLDLTGARSALAVMLDMYPDREPIAEEPYRSTDELLRSSPYFDRGPYNTFRVAHFPYTQTFGGVRARMFSAAYEQASIHPPTVSKVPLVKWSQGMRYFMSTHALAETTMSRVTTALLHFKFLGDFRTKASIEAAREEHFNDGAEYKIYARSMPPGEPFPFMCSASTRFENTDQLAGLGILHVTQDYVSFARRRLQSETWNPAIRPEGLFRTALASELAR